MVGQRCFGRCEHGSCRLQFHLDPASARGGEVQCAISQIVPLFAGIQFLSHEIMLEPDRMIFKRPKYAIPELFVKWSRLKTEGVKVCICATALDRIGFGTLHQFLAKAMPSHRRGYRKGSNVQPSRPNISEQSAQYLTVFVPEKESDRIPFSLSGNREMSVTDRIRPSGRGAVH